MISQKEIITRLIRLQIQNWQKHEQLFNKGIEFNYLWNTVPLNIALDIIGFPPESNTFCHDWIADYLFNKSEKDVPAIVEWIYNEYIELILQKPELFERQ